MHGLLLYLSFAAFPVAVRAASPFAAEKNTPSKKERLLAEKHIRKSVHRKQAPPAGALAACPISLRNTWTNEVLPVDPAQPPAAGEINSFLRCHYTNQSTSMDPRLLGVIVAAAQKFNSQIIEIVSGFRAPKYNLILRKKGHEVARESQHPMGQAVDFRLPGLPTKMLLRYVRSLHLGGVGYYPHSSFVHTDVGRVRFWKGH